MTPRIDLPQAATLTGFRADLYGCLDSWADTLLELCDALLYAPGPVSSVPHLSLEPVFRRSHGSLYKALARGGIDVEALRRALVDHRPKGWPAVFAVDASTWERCDAETSPERGFYYHASRRSAGQPIVAGWSYQWITQLCWAADSWTAPVDARRVPPDADTVVCPGDGPASRASSLRHGSVGGFVESASSSALRPGHRNPTFPVQDVRKAPAVRRVPAIP